MDERPEIDPSTSTAELSPGGQLVLPGHPGAQLGLDGGAYAVSARSAEPSLGPDTPSFARPAAEQQLELFDSAWEVPQLSLWGRMRVRQPLVREREAKCGRTRFKRHGDVEAVRGRSKRWGLKGVISCAKGSCPGCGSRLCRKTAGCLGACFEAHRLERPDGDQLLLTQTVPHRAGDPVETVIGWLFDASAKFWRSKEWRSFAKSYQVEAKVRVFDATHGGSAGTHAHFHVAVFAGQLTPRLSELALLQWEVERAAFHSERARRRAARKLLARRTTVLRRAQEEDQRWEAAEVERLAGLRAFCEVMSGDDESERVRLRDQHPRVRALYLRRAASGLLVAWRRALSSVGCPHGVSGHAVDLAGGERAEAYYCKWGLAEEVGLTDAKARSHVRLLDVVGAGGEQAAIAGEIYRRFARAMRGRAWVTGLTRARRKFGIGKAEADAYVERRRARADAEAAREGRPARVEHVERKVVVRGHLWRAFLARGHEAVFGELDRLIEEDLPRWVAAGISEEQALQTGLERYLARRDTS